MNECKWNMLEVFPALHTSIISLNLFPEICVTAGNIFSILFQLLCASCVVSVCAFLKKTSRKGSGYENGWPQSLEMHLCSKNSFGKFYLLSSCPYENYRNTSELNSLPCEFKKQNCLIGDDCENAAVLQCFMINMERKEMEMLHFIWKTEIWDTGWKTQA
jgi:hypothetical protein